MEKNVTADFQYDIHEHYELQRNKESYIRKGLSGLVNLGNKCFMNSILQCLSNTLVLTDYMLAHKYKEDETALKRKDHYIFLLSYSNLLKNMWETNQLIKPKTFVENMSRFVKKYSTMQQQDSHECMMYILDLLHKALSYEIDVEIKGEVKTPTDALVKKSLESWSSFYAKEYSCITDMFHGMLFNEIACNACDFKSQVFDPFNCLSVDVPETSSTDLQSCLRTYFQENEVVSSWACAKCKSSGCTKTQSAWTLPNTLAVHLKRFSSSGKKIYSDVAFPIDNLDMTSFIASSKNDPNNYMYTLYAVNYHSGDTNSGHYWSCCKNLDDQWYMFNDGHVSKFSGSQDLLTKDAYILFYYRKAIKK